MNYVWEIGSGVYLVSRYPQMRIDYKKAVRDLLRLRFDDRQDVELFLYRHAFALPKSVLSLDYTDMVSLGLMLEESNRHYINPDYPAWKPLGLSKDGIYSRSWVDESDISRGHPFSSLALPSDLFAVVSLSRLEQYRDALAYLANMALASLPTSDFFDGEGSGFWGKVVSDSRLGSRGYYSQRETDADGKESFFNFCCAFDLPPMLSVIIDSQLSRNVLGEKVSSGKKIVSDDGLFRVDCDLPLEKGKVSIGVHSNRWLWDYRNEERLLCRIAAGILFRFLVDEREFALSVSKESFAVSKVETAGMMGALAELFESGEVHSCAWCRKPVIKDKYCDQKVSRCRKNDNEEAHREFDRGYSLETIRANHPAMKSRTIEKWFEKGGASNG